MLENLEIDAGLTYLDNEPLGRVRAVALYHEHYRLDHRRRQSAGRPGERRAGTRSAASRSAC